MRSRVFVWIATGICALTLSAGAGLAKKPTVKNRQGRQVGRIHQGAASGSLTRREAHRLGTTRREFIARSATTGATAACSLRANG